MDASQRAKEEAEAKLKKDMDDANRDDEIKTANNIAERTRRAFEVRRNEIQEEKRKLQSVSVHRNDTNMKIYWSWYPNT